MIDEPKIVRTTALISAVIRLTIPRSEIQTVMGPAINEVLSAVKEQGIKPAGPVYSYHFKMAPETFDLEVGIPVSTPVTSTGRVKPGQLPARKVAQTVYHGNYEGLGAAWGEFKAWIESKGLKTELDLWEFYVSGPESSPDPSNWCTELNQPLID